MNHKAYLIKEASKWARKFLDRYRYLPRNRQKAMLSQFHGKPWKDLSKGERYMGLSDLDQKMRWINYDKGAGQTPDYDPLLHVLQANMLGRKIPVPKLRSPLVRTREGTQRVPLTDPKIIDRLLNSPVPYDQDVIRRRLRKLTILGKGRDRERRVRHFAKNPAGLYRYLAPKHFAREGEYLTASREPRFLAKERSLQEYYRKHRTGRPPGRPAGSKE